jgi:hypothetical protein
LAEQRFIQICELSEGGVFVRAKVDLPAVELDPPDALAFDKERLGKMGHETLR